MKDIFATFKTIVIFDNFNGSLHSPAAHDLVRT